MMIQHMFKVDLRTPHTDLLKQQPVIMNTSSSPFSNMMTTSKSPTTDYQQHQDSSSESFLVRPQRTWNLLWEKFYCVAKVFICNSNSSHTTLWFPVPYALGHSAMMVWCHDVHNRYGPDRHWHQVSNYIFQILINQWIQLELSMAH